MSPNMRRAAAAVVTTWCTVAALLAVVYLGTAQPARDTPPVYITGAGV